MPIPCNEFLCLCEIANGTKVLLKFKLGRRPGVGAIVRFMFVRGQVHAAEHTSNTSVINPTIPHENLYTRHAKQLVLFPMVSNGFILRMGPWILSACTCSVRETTVC